MADQLEFEQVAAAVLVGVAPQVEDFLADLPVQEDTGLVVTVGNSERR